MSQLIASGLGSLGAAQPQIVSLSKPIERRVIDGEVRTFHKAVYQLPNGRRIVRHMWQREGAAGVAGLGEPYVIEAPGTVARSLPNVNYKNKTLHAKYLKAVKALEAKMVKVDRSTPSYSVYLELLKADRAKNALSHDQAQFLLKWFKEKNLILPLEKARLQKYAYKASRLKRIAELLGQISIQVEKTKGAAAEYAAKKAQGLNTKADDANAKSWYAYLKKLSNDARVLRHEASWLAGKEKLNPKQWAAAEAAKAKVAAAKAQAKAVTAKPVTPPAPAVAAENVASGVQEVANAAQSASNEAANAEAEAPLPAPEIAQAMQQAMPSADWGRGDVQVAEPQPLPVYEQQQSDAPPVVDVDYTDMDTGDSYTSEEYTGEGYYEDSYGDGDSLYGDIFLDGLGESDSASSLVTSGAKLTSAIVSDYIDRRKGKKTKVYTPAPYQPSWFEKNRNTIYLAGGVAVAGFIVWKFLKK